MQGGLRVLMLLGALLPAWPAGAPRLRGRPPRPCVDLPEEVLEQMFGRLSVGVMSAFHHALQLEPRGALNRSCPAPADRGRLPVNLLSISPWAYRMSYDPSRYPRYIPEAYCLCEGCLLGAGGREAGPYRSTPLYAPSVVLRRTGSCVGGRHAYTEAYVSVAVGCTCVPLMEKGSQSARRSLKSDSHNQSGKRAEPKARQLHPEWEGGAA